MPGLSHIRGTEQAVTGAKTLKKLRVLPKGKRVGGAAYFLGLVVIPLLRASDSRAKSGVHTRLTHLEDSTK
jgi:hypothetical protein